MSPLSPALALDEKSYMDNFIYFLSKKEDKCTPGQSNSQGYTTIGDEVEVVYQSTVVHGMVKISSVTPGTTMVTH